MKRNYIKILCMTLCALTLFNSCDKIAEENYLIFSGVSGSWYDGSGVTDKTQRVFLEKYTGPRCVNCPTADEAINAALQTYGEQLIVVSIHDSSYFCKPYENSVDMRCDDGDTWSTFFGVKAGGAYPTGMVNRTHAGEAYDLFTPTSGIESRVDAALARSASIALAVNCHTVDNNASINVNLEFLLTVTSDLSLTLLIMEDSIIATQLQPDGSKDEAYVHNHILRDVITDPMGMDVDADGNAGTKRYTQIAYTIDNTTWNLDHCHIVAFIADKNTHEVLNIAECKVS